MEDPFGENQLNHLFELTLTGRLKRNESSRVEYKLAFNIANLVKYARTLSAFANHSGGYIVFGIGNSPREIVGLQNNAFSDESPERIVQDLNSIFSPALGIEKLEHEINGKQIGLLYVYECKTKPVIAKQNQREIKEADIFYRYGARTERIRFPELRAIIDTSLDQEKTAWMKLFQKAAKVGASNAAVLDTNKWTLEGPSDRVVLIDDSLIRQLQFIKEGSFSETRGDPTLKLVGKLVPASVVTTGTKTIAEDPYKFSASMVAQEVSKGIGRQFRSQPEHVWAWKMFKVRPDKNDNNPGVTAKKYCDYKPAIKYYLYNQTWIDFLISQFKNEAKYNAFVESKGKSTG